ncbi:hypothetical protein K1719_038167 [Acacia pycnantha]|nr:hypothetical protein K1719_038167 [Acacia pycnantha]
MVRPRSAPLRDRAPLRPRPRLCSRRRLSRPAFSSSLPLKDRVAIVTGASRGIGQAITFYLHSLGARLVINYALSSNQANLLAFELNKAFDLSNHQAIVVQADVLDLDQVKQLSTNRSKCSGRSIFL